MPQADGEPVLDPCFNRSHYGSVVCPLVELTFCEYKNWDARPQLMLCNTILFSSCILPFLPTTQFFATILQIIVLVSNE